MLFTGVCVCLSLSYTPGNSTILWGAGLVITPSDGNIAELGVTSALYMGNPKLRESKSLTRDGPAAKRQGQESPPGSRTPEQSPGEWMAAEWVDARETHPKGLENKR